VEKGFWESRPLPHRNLGRTIRFSIYAGNGCRGHSIVIARAHSNRVSITVFRRLDHKDPTSNPFGCHRRGSLRRLVMSYDFCVVGWRGYRILVSTYPRDDFFRFTKKRAAADWPALLLAPGRHAG
jgi:hypothetical protein